MGSARAHAHFNPSELSAHHISPPAVTPHSSPPCSVSEAQSVEMVQRPMVAYELMVPAPSSTTLLYHTLVQDGAVPPGFQHEFESLASKAAPPASPERQQVRQSSMRPSSCMHGRRNSGTKSGPRSQRQISSCRQPRSVLASTAPGTCEPSFKGHPLGRTPRNRNATAGPQLSRTPSGSRRLVSSWQPTQATSSQEEKGVRALFGPGSEGSSVSSLGWPCGTSSLSPQPSASSQSTCRCVSKSLATEAPSKVPITQWCSWRPWPGSPQDRFTDSQLYNVLYQELLVAALPGSPAKRAPRVLTAMLVALEHLVVCAQTPRYYRVFSWWLLIQNWATLGFSDHRGILPSSVKIDATGFSAKLTRSKTPGDDRTVASRPLVIDRCCYLAVAGWMQEGWRLLKDMADYPRDCVIPFPSSNGHGCRRRELSYDAASAMQNRVLRMVKSSDEFLFCPSATRFWTPHSNRTFMPKRHSDAWV